MAASKPPEELIRRWRMIITVVLTMGTALAVGHFIGGFNEDDGLEYGITEFFFSSWGLITTTFSIMSPKFMAKDCAKMSKFSEKVLRRFFTCICVTLTSGVPYISGVALMNTGSPDLIELGAMLISGSIATVVGVTVWNASSRIHESPSSFGTGS